MHVSWGRAAGASRSGRGASLQCAVHFGKLRYETRDTARAPVSWSTRLCLSSTFDHYAHDSDLSARAGARASLRTLQLCSNRTTLLCNSATFVEGDAQCNMLPSDILSRSNLAARRCAVHYLEFSAAYGRLSSSALVRRPMPSGVIAASLVSTSWDQPSVSPRASHCAPPAKISSAREKRQTLRLRTANVTTRASKQSMDSSAGFVAKPDKQVSRAVAFSLCRRLLCRL